MKPTFQLVFGSYHKTFRILMCAILTRARLMPLPSNQYWTLRKINTGVRSAFFVISWFATWRWLLRGGRSFPALSSFPFNAIDIKPRDWLMLDGWDFNNRVIPYSDDLFLLITSRKHKTSIDVHKRVSWIFFVLLRFHLQRWEKRPTSMFIHLCPSMAYTFHIPFSAVLFQPVEFLFFRSYNGQEKYTQRN